MNKQALAIFIIRCVWIIAALVIWIIALNTFLHPKGDYAYVNSGLLCLIPMAFPVIRFILRITGVMGNIGSQYYDVDITSSGRIVVHNHRFMWAFVTFIIVTAITIFAGIFILPFYWLYVVYCTTVMGIRLFKR